MKILIQRVNEAFIKIGNSLHASTGKGILIFVGVSSEDTGKEVPWLAEKAVNLRIFEDDKGKMNLSVKDIQGEIAVVSQFTLYADAGRGRRPGFSGSAEPEKALNIFNSFVEEIRKYGLKTAEGKFGEYMEIGLVNSGPATFIIEK